MIYYEFQQERVNSRNKMKTSLLLILGIGIATEFLLASRASDDYSNKPSNAIETKYYGDNYDATDYVGMNYDVNFPSLESYLGMSNIFTLSKLTGTYTYVYLTLGS